ncbi:unnamed protein product, partial [Rotaria socialis]
HLVPAFLNTIYSHDPSASLLNFNADTLTFTNPSSVYYLDNPSTRFLLNTSGAKNDTKTVVLDAYAQLGLYGGQVMSLPIDDALNTIRYISSICLDDEEICDVQQTLQLNLLCHNNRKQFLEQTTLSSRQIRLEIPLRKNDQIIVDVSVIFENDRVVPSFLSTKLAFGCVRHETLRLSWVDVAIISENLD